MWAPHYLSSSQVLEDKSRLTFTIKSHTVHLNLRLNVFFFTRLPLPLLSLPKVVVWVKGNELSLKWPGFDSRRASREDGLIAPLTADARRNKTVTICTSLELPTPIQSDRKRDYLLPPLVVSGGLSVRPGTALCWGLLVWHSGSLLATARCCRAVRLEKGHRRYVKYLSDGHYNTHPRCYSMKL